MLSLLLEKFRASFYFVSPIWNVSFIFTSFILGTKRVLIFLRYLGCALPDLEGWNNYVTSV